MFAVNAPAETVVFSDDFETDKGWVRNPNGTDTATTGLWERGDPEATDLERAEAARHDDERPQRPRHGPSGRRFRGSQRPRRRGHHDPIARDHPARDRHPDASPSSTTWPTGRNSSTADFFRVFVVAGSTSTQVFQSLGAASNRNGAWTPVSVSLNSFAGQTVRLRIEAADASTASLVEAAVDDVRITRQ